MKKEIANSFCMFNQTSVEVTYNPLLIKIPKIPPPTPPPINTDDPILRAQKEILSNMNKIERRKHFPLKDLKGLGF